MTASTARIIFWLIMAANVVVVITAWHHQIQAILIPAAAFFIGFAFGTRYGIDR